MTIHRIHQNSDFLVYNIPSQEVLNKLGRAYPFHIDRSPIPFAHIWKPLHIKFLPVVHSKSTSIPDISMGSGRLFLNTKAFKVLHKLLENDGEFLPVTYNGGEGMIFNPLTIAEDLNALNEKLIGHDEHGNLEHFEFIEEKLQDTAIFRARIDDCYGLFCGDTLKEAVEQAGLTGVYFQPDLANFTGEAYPNTQ